MPLPITPDVVIDDGDLEERFVRASGPGGQHVNKVATAVQLRFHATRSAALSGDARERLRALAGNRMTNDGVLVIDARAHRTQSRNRDAARARLAALIRRALSPPKDRQRTRTPAREKLERLHSKRRRADTKQSRGRVTDE